MHVKYGEATARWGHGLLRAGLLSPTVLQRAVPYLSTSGFVWVRVEATRTEDSVGPSWGRRSPVGAGFVCTQTYLLLHPTFQQHCHTRLNGEGDLPATDHEVLFQRLPEGRFLYPGL